MREREKGGGWEEEEEEEGVRQCVCDGADLDRTPQPYQKSVKLRPNLTIDQIDRQIY